MARNYNDMRPKELEEALATGRDIKDKLYIEVYPVPKELVDSCDKNIATYKKALTENC